MTERAPRRIQRQRSRGWTMPANTVYVGRPSVFGNPFRITGKGDLAGRAEAVKAFAKYCRERPRFLEIVREQLRGKNLACWCTLEQSCHADILLGIANT